MKNSFLRNSPLSRFFLGDATDERFKGSGASDVAFGFGGDDVLLGRGGRDVLFGGRGNDRIDGGGGRDILSGGRGDDRIDGGNGRDVLSGGAGDDDLSGGNGRDVLSGGLGDDLLDGGRGSDRIEGGEGRDTIITGKGRDEIVLADNQTAQFDPADGVRQVTAASEDFVQDFDFRKDSFALDAGAFAVEGPLVFANAEAPAPAQATGPEAGFSVEVGRTVVDEAFLDEALDGALYYNIHTEAFPAGEIRGQLLVASDTVADGVRTIELSAALDAAQEPGPTSDSDATGQATLTITQDLATGEITYTSTLSVDGITEADLSTPAPGVLSAVHIHNAPAGSNGPIVRDTLVDAGAEIDPAATAGSTGVTGADVIDATFAPLPDFAVEVEDQAVADGGAFVDAALAGELYFNIHTGDFPAGEIRGQLSVASDEVADGIRTIELSAALDAAQEPGPTSDSDATGQGSLTITQDPATGEVSYSATLSVTGIEIEELRSPNAGTLSPIHIHEAPAGSNGPIVRDVLVDAGAEIDADAPVGSIGVADLGVFETFDVAFDGFKDANVIVLKNTDDDDDPDTVFNAGSAANLIAEQVDEEGAGFFVYHNSALGVNRLVYSTDLSDGAADLQILARLDDLSGDAAIAALDDFGADNFVFENELPFGGAGSEGGSPMGTYDDLM